MRRKIILAVSIAFLLVITLLVVLLLTLGKKDNRFLMIRSDYEIVEGHDNVIFEFLLQAFQSVEISQVVFADNQGTNYKVNDYTVKKLSKVTVAEKDYQKYTVKISDYEKSPDATIQPNDLKLTINSQIYQINVGTITFYQFDRKLYQENIFSYTALSGTNNKLRLEKITIEGFDPKKPIDAISVGRCENVSFELENTTLTIFVPKSRNELYRTHVVFKSANEQQVIASFTYFDEIFRYENFSYINYGKILS